VKTSIVVGYFKPWAKIMANAVRHEADPKLTYIDLYSGPGRYENGLASTPIQILEHAVSSPDLQQMLLAMFNDENADHTSALTKAISELPDIGKLKRYPRIRTGAVDQALVDRFKNSSLGPSFSFIDPFGFKGLTLDLVDTLVRSWGSDLVLFFSFNSINRSLTIPSVKKHIDALFGQKKAEELRVTAKTVATEKREELLIEKFIEAINDLGYDYVLPYVVERDDKDRTSHYLIFISKDKRGYSIMKDIMYALSEDKTEGVAKFGFVRSISKKRTPLLALMNSPLKDFADQLCIDFAGQTLSRKLLRDHYDLMYPRNPFVDKNWRDTLMRLEEQDRISAVPSRENRPKRKGETTFGKNTKVTFPDRAKANGDTL
jgi:three-Cys-motif partner protein